MQKTLRENLRRCATAFAVARGLKLSTLGRMAANDGPFFIRLADPTKTFTAKKYDEVMVWLLANWPVNAEWPAEVPVPSAECIEADGDSPAHAGGPSVDPIPEISESPAASHGPGDRVVTSPP